MSATKSYQEITADGLWNNNPALVQLLGLCPLLAVTGSVVNALGLGIATILVLVGSNLSVSMIRNFVPEQVRLPAFVMIIASFVTCAELLMQAFTYELYLILGIFIPLIVTNCVILGRADAFASKNPVIPAATDGFMMGIGFTVVLVLLGAMRELLGQGTLFENMQLLFGPMAANWKIVVFEDYSFLFAILPPGAFVGMGLLIALKNIVDGHLKARAERNRADEPKPTVDRRVRVTG
ncbi:electron transport complex subunit E [Oceanospirillum linum]|uniref:Ion-translocating oxidoreductase complex subunit E n=1 Tax=Oceanospirillum linum TaxID=966 RepID=A0A1T1HE88_OCELI|nr:electron transport complex subunit E [Oceanospirillum linum]OOV88122.1 electron transport complex subunit RsxE [Oceanospirillum linum]SEF43810.1 electron transport complex protein RnfE [Oleiphilus messinensis]SMP01472.1 electron transport complex protein RnfE [Oceanospirillum linum]